MLSKNVNLEVNKVFIKKPNANPNAADYPFVVPTQQDDTKPEEKIKLSEVGLYPTKSPDWL